jgi:hypothetical protein
LERTCCISYYWFGCDKTINFRCVVCELGVAKSSPKSQLALILWRNLAHEYWIINVTLVSWFGTWVFNSENFDNFFLKKLWNIFVSNNFELFLSSSGPRFSNILPSRWPKKSNFLHLKQSFFEILTN